MFESAGRLVYRGRWTLLVLSLAAAVLVAPLGLELFGRMADGGFEDPRADSTTAAHWNEEWYGGNTPDVVVLYRHPAVKVSDPRYKKAVHDSLRALPARYVRRPATYWSTGSKGLRSKDGHATYALITLKGGAQTKRNAYAAIAGRLRRVENLRVSVGGSVPLLKELNDQTAADLARAEAISMPVLLVLLVVVFGSLVAAGLPLLIGLLAVLGALVLLRLLTEVTEVSVFSLNVVTMLGLGLAVDYSLFVLKAFREEIRGGASNEQAVVRTMATAGRTVALSGLTVATALLGLLLFPQMFLRSIGLGAAAVVLVAMGAALVVLPAVLGMLGPRVDALRVTPALGRGDGGLRHAVASSVMRRPVPYLVAVTAVLLALTVPFLHVKFGDVDYRVLPAASESRRVAETLDRDFARNSMAPIDVHVLVERSFTGEPATPGPLGQGWTPVSAVTPVTPLDVEPLTDRLKRLPGVTGVDVTGLSQDHGALRLAVRYSADPMSDAARHLVTVIRGMPPEPNVRAVVVGGVTAARMDLLDSLAATLPWMALVVCGVTGVLLTDAANRWSPSAVASPGAGAARAAAQSFSSPAVSTETGTIGACRAISPNADGPGWHWAEEEAVRPLAVDGRPAVFGVDTDPVPLTAEPDPAPRPVPQLPPRPLPSSAGLPSSGGSSRKRPYGSPEEGRPSRPGWVKMREGRTKVVRANPDGPGWTWVEVDT